MQLVRHTVNFTDSSNEEFKAKMSCSSGQVKTILLIDDEEMVINIIEMMLKEIGYNALKAHNGQEGLQLFKTYRYKIDLIISDLEMPKMNGKEVLDKLRKIDPEIKVMLSSGALTDIDEQIVINNGFNGFLKKPYSLTTLREKMSEVFCPNFQ